MKRSFLLVTCIAASLLLSYACQKEEDTIAEVTVLTTNGTPVEGAEVRMFGQGTENTDTVGGVLIDRTLLTNAAGIASFDFTDVYEPGQSGFAVLNVEITKVTPSETLTAEGLFKVVEEEVSRKTFEVE